VGHLRGKIADKAADTSIAGRIVPQGFGSAPSARLHHTASTCGYGTLFGQLARKDNDITPDQIMH
jgi:hypothetical protein